MADAAVSGWATQGELLAVLDAQAGWPGISAARWVVDHADPWAESALESLGRLTFIEADLPVPLSNVWVGETGRRYRVDHLLDDVALAFEGDGNLKFAGPDAGDVVTRMREREWRLRDIGLGVARYGWDLASTDRVLLADRFRAEIARRPARRARFPWARDAPRRRPLDGPRQPDGWG